MQNQLQAMVKGIRIEATGVRSIELSPLEGTFPAARAGSHIDLILPNGLIRQYSLLGGGSPHHYKVGVGLAEPSRGGSKWVHTQIKVGDALKISAPRNNFPVASNEHHSVLIAGGIGITPLHFMAHELSQQGRSWTLYYCVRDASRAAFLEELTALAEQHSIEGSTLHLVVDNGQTERQLDLAKVVAEAEPNTHFYCCGPLPLLNAFNTAMASLPDEQVHSEYFSVDPNANGAEASQENGAFTVVLAKSNRTFTIPPDRSILDTLSEQGVSIYSSCREGICGSCETRVIEGDIEHRDSVLSPDERQRNQSIMLCVSRAKSDTLVLDL